MTDVPCPSRPPAPAFEMAGPACCPPPAAPCCPPLPPGAGGERPGYRLWPFVEGWLDTPVGPVPRVGSRLSRRDVAGRWQMRWGVGRDRYRLAPGLYALGSPTADSPVLVTANYKLTFDALRRDAGPLDAWVLVLETYGINVWCAAGKGTFGTAELVRRVAATGLDRVVAHRRLVLPQLGAVGVAAREVTKATGFAVTWGPVRAADLPRFLALGMKATPEMRRVTFGVTERLILTPVELVAFTRPAARWALLGVLALAGLGPGFFSFSAAWSRGLDACAALLVAVLAGAVATPVLLPWLPGRAFAAKGAVAGGGAALGLAAAGWAGVGGGELLALGLGVPALSSYAAMNFTGSTPFTSPSGVEREMRRALPWQIGAGAGALLAWLASAF